MDKKQMYSVLRAFRASENCWKCLRYLDEIEDYIDQEFLESDYIDALEQLRNFIVKTNEMLQRNYLRESDKEKCKDFCDI